MSRELFRTKLQLSPSLGTWHLSAWASPSSQAWLFECPGRAEIHEPTAVACSLMSSSSPALWIPVNFLPEKPLLKSACGDLVLRRVNCSEEQGQVHPVSGSDARMRPHSRDSTLPRTPASFSLPLPLWDVHFTLHGRVLQRHCSGPFLPACCAKGT